MSVTKGAFLGAGLRSWCVAAALAVLLVAGAAQAQYTAIEITAEDDFAPAPGYSILQKPSISNTGKVAFSAGVNVGGGEFATVVFLDDGVAGSVPVALAVGADAASVPCTSLISDPMARTGRCIDSVIGNDVIVNNTDTVAFEVQGVFALPGEVTDIIKVSEPLPPRIALKATTTPRFRFPTDLNSNLLLGGFDDSGFVTSWLEEIPAPCQRIYRGDGSGLATATIGIPIPDPSPFQRRLDSCDPPDLDGQPWDPTQFFATLQADVSTDGFRIAFPAQGELDDGSLFGRDITGIFIFGSSGLDLVYEGDVFDFNNRVAVNNSGTVVFEEFVPGGMRLATQSETIASTAGSGFDDFDDWAINNVGDIVFVADSGAVKGLYLTRGQSRTTLLQTGDTLFGRTVTGISFNKTGFNDAGEVAALVQLAGVPGVSLARPVVVKFTPATGTPEIVVTDSTGAPDDLLVEFGNVLLNAPETETITVANNGSAPLSIASASIGDPLSPAIAVVNEDCTGTVLAAGESCEVVVQFSAPDGQAYSNTVLIISDDTDESMVTVQVTGQGRVFAVRVLTPDDDPAMPTSNGRYFYGAYTVGYKTSRPFILENIGNEPVLITAYNGITEIEDEPFNGPFGEPASLSPGASVEFFIEFVPPTTGPFEATLEIEYTSSNDPLVPSQSTSLTVSGEGTAAVPEIRVNEQDEANDGTLDFGTVLVGSTPTREIAIINNASGTLDLRIGNLPTSPFDVLPPFCTDAYLGPDQGCVYRIRLNAMMPGDPVSELTYSYGDENNRQTGSVQVVANIVDSPIRIADTTEPLNDAIVMFPDTIRGESAIESITVTNVATNPVTLGPLAGVGMPVMDPFIIESNDCSNATLDPGATCDVTFSFRPALDSDVGPVEQEIEVPVVDPVSADAVVVLSGNVTRDVDFSATIDISTRRGPDPNGGDEQILIIEYIIEVVNNGSESAQSVRIGISSEATFGVGNRLAATCTVDDVEVSDCFSNRIQDWNLPALEPGQVARAVVSESVADETCRVIRGSVLVFENSQFATEPSAEASAEVELISCTEEPEPEDTDIPEFAQGNDPCPFESSLVGRSRDSDLASLRAFRDKVLARFALGRQATSMYYRMSPTVVDYLEDHAWARTAMGKAGHLLASMIRSPWQTLAGLLVFVFALRSFRRYLGSRRRRIESAAL